MLVIRKSNLFNFHLKNKSNMKNIKIRENQSREIYRIYLSRSRNSTIPSCILSRDLRYGVYLPFVISKVEGWLFIKTKIFQAKSGCGYTILKNGTEYPHEGCKINCLSPSSFLFPLKGNFKKTQLNCALNLYLICTK